ncbi:hypothetical protein ACFL1N_09970 [Thermodesulfobacteriota bacterium]
MRIKLEPQISQIYADYIRLLTSWNENRFNRPFALLTQVSKERKEMFFSKGVTMVYFLNACEAGNPVKGLNMEWHPSRPSRFNLFLGFSLFALRARVNEVNGREISF